MLKIMVIFFRMWSIVAIEGLPDIEVSGFQLIICSTIEGPYWYFHIINDSVLIQAFSSDIEWNLLIYAASLE